MKRAFILLVAISFLITAAGCAPKSKYEKLLNEKIALEKKCEQVTTERERLKEEVAGRQGEIADLSGQLRETKAKVRSLDDELTKAKEILKKLEK